MRDERIRRRVVVRGHVQGVFFREGVRQRAAARGVAGWVVNRADGAVEAVFEGREDDVIALLSFCRGGPRGARVETVEISEERPEGLEGFAVG